MVSKSHHRQTIVSTAKSTSSTTIIVNINLVGFDIVIFSMRESVMGAPQTFLSTPRCH
jgi:hypothetical protein